MPRSFERCLGGLSSGVVVCCLLPIILRQLLTLVSSALTGLFLFWLDALFVVDFLTVAQLYCGGQQGLNKVL